MAEEKVSELLDEERRFALTGAAQAFCNRGIDIACPWEGDLDDREREVFEALVAAIDSYNTIMARRTPTPVTEDVGDWSEKARNLLARIDKNAGDPHVQLDHHAHALEVLLGEAADLIDVALSTSPSPPKADGPGEDGWQPIETAKRDNRPIQLGRHGYIPMTGYGSPNHTDWWNPGMGGCVPFEPTHWRPLPTPPKGGVNGDQVR